MAQDNPIRDDLEETLNTTSVAFTCPTCGIKLAYGTTICPSDGTIVDADDSIMQRIRQTYEILEVISSGGMGVVYKATHKILGKPVAIKMLKPGYFHETALVRFQREGKIASALSHPNVVAIYDFGVSEFGQPFMVMEFVPGVSLADKIREKGSLSIEESRQIVMQVCEALQEAHGNGILHRDVKPTNIMLVDGTTKVKVVDFGIAKFIEPGGADMSLTESGASLGSPLYMSPEQSTGKKLDGRTDLYSLGCVLFECLTGTPPFVGKSAVETILLHCNETPSSLKEASLGQIFPDSLEALVARLLNKDPEKRFQTADEILRALRDLEKPPEKVFETSEKAQVRALPVMVGCAIAVAAVVVSILTLNPSVAPTPPAPPTPSPVEKKLPPIESSDLSKYDRPTSIAFFNNQINASASVVDASGFDLRDSDLEELKKDHRLNAIRVNDTKISDRGMATLGKIEKLWTISADHTKITDAGIANIAGLQNLGTLHVSENQLTDACTVPMAKLKALAELTMRDTLLSDKGIKRLTGLKHMRSLQLNRTLVTDAGVKLIAESFPELEELDARSNQGITARSLKYLEGAHKLRLLTLSGCDISARAMRTYFETHPKVQERASAKEKMMLDFTAP